MAQQRTKWTRLIRIVGIVCAVLGALAIAIDYHRIASCSVSKVPPGCGLVLNVEGVGFALLFAGAIAVMASFVLNAFLTDDLPDPHRAESSQRNDTDSK